MTARHWLAVILAALIALLVLSLWRRDRDTDSAIDLEDLLLGPDGRISKAAAVMLGAFLLTTWLMIYLAITGKMTEGYLAIYVAAWITPTVAKLIKGESPPPAPPTGPVPGPAP